MADYDNTNRGVLFKNDKKGNDKRPDYTGKIDVEGKEYALSAWIKEGKSGKFMSITIQEPFKETEGRNEQANSGEYDDSEIPF